MTDMEKRTVARFAADWKGQYSEVIHAFVMIPKE